MRVSKKSRCDCKLALGLHDIKIVSTTKVDSVPKYPVEQLGRQNTST